VRSVPAGIAVRNLAAIRAIHDEAGGDDAETLARLFEDGRLEDDGTLLGRVGALLEATAHRWLPGRSTVLDVPGLHELKGFGDRGFRDELRDPWPGSREQIGHLLTALRLALWPEVVERRRFGLSLRRWVGAPPEMSASEVALRFAIGHEKAPDPGRFDPLMLLKVRRQFRSAGDRDVTAFLRAVREAVRDETFDAALALGRMRRLGVGRGAGNSVEDLTLTLAGYVLAERIRSGSLARRRDIAAWIRAGLCAPRSAEAEALADTRDRSSAGLETPPAPARPSC
jgi:hypothetical protein